MPDELATLKTQALTQLEEASDAQRLEEWRIAYLGRRSPLQQALRGLGSLPPEERRARGAEANELKALLEERYQSWLAELRQAEARRALLAERLDVTLPGRRPRLGRLHPTTQAVREVCAAFGAMGF